MKNKLLLVSMVAILMVASLVLACAPKPEVPPPAPTPTSTPSPSPASAPELPPLKIGFISMMTGFVSGYGPLETIAVNFALDEVGWEVAGRKIELIWEDGASDVNICVDKARKMVELDKVDVIIGPIFSPAFVAVAAYLKPHGIPLIYMFAGSNEAMEADPGNVFASNGQDTGSNYSLGAYAADMGYTTAVAMIPDLSYAMNCLAGFSMGFEERGGTIVQTQTIPMGTKDFYPYLVALKKADIVVFFATALDAPVLVTQYRDYGAKMPLWALGSDILTAPGLQECGEDALDIISQAPWSPHIDTPENKAFMEAFTQKMGEPPDDTIETNYQAVQLVLEAVNHTGGDTSAEALIKALSATDMGSTRGRVTMSPEGIAISDHYIVKVVFNEKYGMYDWDVVTAVERPIIK